MYKIEKGVPIGKDKTTMPLRDMNVGDSIFVAEKDKMYAKLPSYVSTQNYLLRPMKFSQKLVDGGRRVWRIE